MSHKRTIASSLGGNGDSGDDRMRLGSEEAIRSFLTDEVVSSSTVLFPEILRWGHVLLSVSTSLPLSTNSSGDVEFSVFLG